MKTLFIDCNDQLAPVWRQALRAGDPPIDVNRAAFTPDDLPRLLDGYEICVDDHSYLPTPIAARCAALKHVVFLGTGASAMPAWMFFTASRCRPTTPSPRWQTSRSPRMRAFARSKPR